MGTETPTCMNDHAEIEESMRKVAELMAQLTEVNAEYTSAYDHAEALLTVARHARREYDDYVEKVLTPLSKQLTELRSVIQDHQGRLMTQVLGGMTLPTVN